MAMQLYLFLGNFNFTLFSISVTDVMNTNFIDMEDTNAKVVTSSVGFMISSLASIMDGQVKAFESLMQQREQQLKELQSLVFEKGLISERYNFLKSRQSEKRQRQRWKNPGRTDIWWQNLFTGEMLEQEWTYNLRMDCQTFQGLVNELSPYISPKLNSFRADTLSADKKVAMTLYYLKDQGSYRMTANTFGVSKDTMSVVIRSVCTTINEVLGPRLIKFPATEQEIKDAVFRFEDKFGFPQAIGCVDGTHIPIKQPLDSPHDYFCYKMKYSLNCQSICDEKGRFIDIDLRWPGSVHDARLYA